MVQIVQARNQPTRGEKISAGLGAGVDFASQIMQRQQAQRQMQQENEALQQLTGMDFSGITDPMQRKEILSSLMQGQNQQSLQELKGFQKQQRDIEKQGFLSRLFPESKNIEKENEQSGYNPINIRDSDIAKAAAIDPAIARELRAAKDEAQKERRAKEKTDFEREKLGRHEEVEISKPILLEMNEVRKNIPLQEQAIDDIMEASPEVSGLDFFADITGFEPLRSAAGAKLKTGIKDFFLSDLSRAGARPNQWIEQQLADALPKIGRSAEANLITSEGLKFKVDLAKKRMELIDSLAEKDRKKHGFVKADIDSRAYNQMKKYVIDRQKELKENIEKIKAKHKGKQETVRMISPDGNIYDILSDDIDEALQNDFTFRE